MNLQAAIFDMDGTLLDSMGIWTTIGRRYLTGLGIEPSPEVDDVMKTLSMTQEAEYLRDEFGVNKDVPTIVREINKMMETAYREVIQPKPGVREFLNLLAARGIPMCIATSTDRCLVETGLKRLGLASYFDFILPCSEVGSGKDEPMIFELAESRLGRPRAETVVFEDCLYAIRTAKKAGFPAVAIHDEPSAHEWDEIRSLSDVAVQDFVPLAASLRDVAGAPATVSIG